MRVRVFPLRKHGRRMERAELPDGVPGDLRMYSLVQGTEMHRVARLCTRTDGAAYVQEWRCLLE